MAEIARAFVLVFTLIVVEEASFSAETEKLAIPTPDQQASAQKTIAELYRDEYQKATSPTDRIALAKKLIQVGADTRDDAPAQFVLWRIARDVATGAADYDLAATAVDKTSDRFAVDPLAIKVDAIQAVVQATKAVPNYQKLFPAAESLLDKLTANERFDLAENVLGMLTDLAAKMGKPDLAAEARQRKELLQHTKAAYADVPKALETLRRDQDDAAANGVVGRFRCFVVGEWGKGLPALAKCDNESFRSIAARDLAVPSNTTSQQALADDWWNVADAEKENIQSVIRARAVYWYQKAIPRLSGLAKQKAEKRAASIVKVSQQPTVADTPHDSGTPKKPDAKPKPPTVLAGLVQEESQRCHRARDALLLYRLFLADNSVPDEAKSLAQKQIAGLEDAAAKDYVRLGSKWVSRDEARAAHEQAELLVKGALDMLSSNNAKLAKQSLEKASRIDPNATRADFLLGVLYALVGRDYNNAHARFLECIRRDPQDVCTLNNVALIEVMQNSHQSALNHLRDAVAVDPTVPELAHNIRRILSETGARNLAMPAGLESSFSDLYGQLVRSGATEEKVSKGWLYMPPVVARTDYVEPDAPSRSAPEEPPSAKSPQPSPKSPAKAAASKPRITAGPTKPSGSGTGVIASGGTGFVVYPHHILTNQHVVDGHQTVLIIDPNDPGSKRLTGKVIAQSEEPDLAIVRCDALDAPTIAVNPHLPGRGTDVMILGFPEFFDIGTNLKSTRGTIAGLPDPAIENLCTYDATTNPGNSGGPVCDNTGRVIAIHRWGLRDKHTGEKLHINAGIPCEQAIAFLREHIPTFQPADNGQKLEWPDVDALASKSTVLVLCCRERDREVAIPDTSDSGFESTANQPTTKAAEKQPSNNVRPGDGCFEDTGCIACRASGDVKCPNCQNGTVRSTKITQIPTPTGITIQRDMVRVPCEVCHGTGLVACPACHGSGHDPSIR